MVSGLSEVTLTASDSDADPSVSHDCDGRATMVKGNHLTNPTAVRCYWDSKRASPTDIGSGQGRWCGQYLHSTSIKFRRTSQPKPE